MDREEASFILANIDRRVCDDGLNEALDMAIKALDQEPCRYWQNGKCNGNTEVCEDAISRQDVLDLAKKGVLISNGNYASVCKAINELPSAEPKTGHWIPVGERMPDKFDRYLISTDDGRVETIGYGYTDDLPNEIAFHEWDDEEWQCWKPNVTAWMPLPKPYEPQERSGEE